MFEFIFNWTLKGLKIIYCILFYFILLYLFYFKCLEKLWDISEISSRVGLTEQSEGSS